jgi:hypothetical protein
MAAWVLDEILKVLHPFMPFVTEELWRETAGQGPQRDTLLALSGWPAGRRASTAPWPHREGPFAFARKPAIPGFVPFLQQRFRFPNRADDRNHLLIPDATISPQTQGRTDVAESSAAFGSRDRQRTGPACSALAPIAGALDKRRFGSA